MCRCCDSVARCAGVPLEYYESTILNYETVEREFASADLESSAAEAHGVISGLLCGGAKDAERTWLQELTSRRS